MGRNRDGPIDPGVQNEKKAGKPISLGVHFGQPLRAQGEQTDHAYPAYDFPFAYASQTDPLTGHQVGLLDRCNATQSCPKNFDVATVMEIREGRQSLGLTDQLGHSEGGMCNL